MYLLDSWLALHGAEQGCGPVCGHGIKSEMVRNAIQSQKVFSHGMLEVYSDCE
jgi:hypothetical protein